MVNKYVPKYPDINAVLVPSPRRVRNKLTLEEQVQVLEIYDRHPMYTKVAKLFKCSWEQIKNIVANRDAIMSYHTASVNTSSAKVVRKEETKLNNQVRTRDLVFLGQCLYEWVQRSIVHQKTTYLTQELLLMKAFEFRDFLKLDNFTPDTKWVNDFKKRYNISLSHKHGQHPKVLLGGRKPPDSFEMSDIVEYCSNRKPSKAKTYADVAFQSETPLHSSTAHNNSNAGVPIQQRTISFLERALYEYIQRSHYHYRLPLSEIFIMKLACKLRDKLRIFNFVPNASWYDNFQQTYRFSLTQFNTHDNRIPPRTLDWADIFSYCSFDRRQLATTTQELTFRVEPPNNATKSSLRSASSTAVHSESQPHQRQQQTEYLETVEMIPAEQIKAEVLELDADAVEEDEEQHHDVSTLMEASYYETDLHSSPPTKRLKVDEDPVSTTAEQTVQSDSNPASESSVNEGEQPPPPSVHNYGDILKLLKPMEEFAMLENNFRLIGLISQVEDICKIKIQKTKKT